MNNSRYSLPKELLSLAIAMAILLCFHCLTIWAFSVKIDWTANLTVVEKAIYLNRFYSDFFLILGLSAIFYGRANLSRLVSALVLFFALIMFFIQYQSVVMTGGFLPSIALENVAHIDLLDLNSAYLSGIIWSILFLLACRLVYVCIRHEPRLVVRFGFACLMLILSSIIKNDKHYLSNELVTDRFSFYNSGRPGFPHVSPLSELGDTFKEYRTYLYKQNWLSEKKLILSPTASEFAFQHYKYLGKTNKDYPLVHESKFDHQLPFADALNQTNKKNKNVIIFFFEGISSRIIQPYSQLLPNISPNIANFANQKNIRIDNYYNHTYATYRGLGGQLCSIYPLGRLLKETTYNCMPHILMQAGYTTHFMFSQTTKKTNLGEVFTRAGIQEIDSATTIRELLHDQVENNGPLSEAGRSATDRELMLGLIERLKQAENNDKPYFYGVYNLETHTGLHLFMDDTTYKRENGENSYVLDGIHNLDKSFGLFWDYFKNSAHIKDTIVIVTSDHATFPGRDYKKLSLGSPSIFVDKIPLLIYHPDMRSSFVFDAESRTSIDFAPTILNILGIPNQNTHFLGESLFSSGNRIPPSAAGSHSAIWHLDKEADIWLRVSNRTNRQREYLAPAIDHFELINYLSDLERQNKLWPSPN